jgi:hypothetical protein
MIEASAFLSGAVCDSPSTLAQIALRIGSFRCRHKPAAAHCFGLLLPGDGSFCRFDGFGRFGYAETRWNTPSRGL